MVNENGTVETNEEATDYIKDLDIFSCVKLEDDSPAKLSLGMLCNTMDYTNSWETGKLQSPTKKTESHLNVVPNTMSPWSQHQSTLERGDSLPDWLQPFTEGSEEPPTISVRRLHARRRTRSSNGDVCLRTKTMGAQMSTRPEMLTDGYALPSKVSIRIGS